MAHAILSPSSASRWMVCTPSARLEAKLPDSSGEAAREGTLAHKLGETLILRRLNLISKSTFDREILHVEKDLLYKPEMRVYCDDYADYVMEVYNTVKTKDPDAQIFLEEKIDMSAFVPEGFGTGDCQIIGDGTLHFIDLKYGKGVPVSAQKNEQVMLYAAGALRKWDLLYDISKITCHIFQPRIDNIDAYTIDAETLIQWVNDEVRPAAKKAFAGEGDFVPGEKQCRFCRVRATCRAFAEYNLETARHAFEDITQLNDTEIAEILEKAATFKHWLKSVEEHALLEAVHNNKQWPGFKLVEGRSNRKFTDQKAVAMRLNGAGVQDFYKPLEVRGITELTAMLGKKRFGELLDGFIIKPAGAPALVPEADKRPALDSTKAAQGAFASIYSDDDF